MSSAELHHVYNFLPLSEDVGTAGQPTEEQIEAIETAGYQVVVNLDMPDRSPTWNEAEVVAAHGMEYVHIPVVWESPQPVDLDRFMDTMDTLKGRKVFVHCAANARVSAFMFLYRVIRQGVPVASAVESVRRIWEPNAVWREFIDESLARFGVGDRWQ